MQSHEELVKGGLMIQKDQALLLDPFLAAGQLHTVTQRAVPTHGMAQHRCDHPMTGQYPFFLLFICHFFTHFIAKYMVILSHRPSKLQVSRPPSP
jgi:hypothetical protein